MVLHALSIGIDDFQDPSIRRLRYARKDAAAMAQLFERIAPEERSIHTLFDREATLRNVEKRVDDLCRNVSDEDVVLIYIASHGTPERRSATASLSAFLALHDTEYAYIHATGLDLELRLSDWMVRLEEASFVAVILDTCFSGATGGRTFARRLMGDGPPPRVSLRGLDLGRGSVILTAADEAQVARESEALGHGLFTYHLLEALQPPSGGPATIGVGALYERVARAVSEATEGQQRPILNGRSNLAALPLFPR
ncbi:Polysaccharide deacetylase [Minicystis rosea]|nr:Polysaccharide deacetylase [Minicystis rosea]